MLCMQIHIKNLKRFAWIGDPKQISLVLLIKQLRTSEEEDKHIGMAQAQPRAKSFLKTNERRAENRRYEDVWSHFIHMDDFLQGRVELPDQEILIW